MRTTETVAQISKALAEAQAEMSNPTKGRTARVKSDKADYTYQYADLATVLEAVRPALSKHGIALIQDPVVSPPEVIRDGDRVWRIAYLVMTTRLMHVSGEWIENELRSEINPEERVQTLGSAITYLRRYALQALVGVTAEEDDDGVAAQGRQHQEQRQPQAERPALTSPVERVRAAQAAPAKPAQRPAVQTAAPKPSQAAAAVASTVNGEAKVAADLSEQYKRLQIFAGPTVAKQIWNHFGKDDQRAARLDAMIKANANLRTITERLGASNADDLLRDILQDRADPENVDGILADLARTAGNGDQPPH